METFEFGPGEEKLERVVRMLVSHEQFILQLSQRSEVDSIMISLLLDELPEPQSTLERWQAKISSYYPDKAVELLGNDLLARSGEELNRRVSLWTRALQGRAQAAHDSD